MDNIELQELPQELPQIEQLQEDINEKEELLEKLKEYSTEQLHKIFNKKVTKRTENKKDKYTLSYYNFDNGKYEQVANFTNIKSIIQYLKKHNVQITEYNLKHIMNAEQNNFIKIELI